MAKGIYKITNDRTGEVYVGQAKDLKKRKNTHFRELAQGKHINKGMQKDHNLGDTFTFEIIEQMPNATLADLKNKESQYITKFNSFREGYNRTPGGAMDQFKGKYKYGGGRLPLEKYKPTEKYLTRVLGDCPQCEGNLIKKEGKFGEYVCCDNFPKCKFTCSIDQINQQSNIPNINYKPVSTPKTKYTTVTYDEPLDFKPLTIPKKPKTTSKSKKKPLKTEFEKFCTKKKNYLTKSDCDYLAEKYEIDISQVNTVKKANPIIRNYLNNTGQWETAMEDLYKNNNRPIRKKDQHAIGAFVLGYCPECNGKLIRMSKFFIQCENYPSCSFSCSDNYYNKHILTLNSEDEIVTSEVENSKTKFNMVSETSNVKAIPKHTDFGENEFNKKEKSVVNEEAEQQLKQSNAESTKSDDEKINYCSNCGVKLDLEYEYCGNCGEKIDSTNEERIEEEKSIKQYLFYCKDETSNEFRPSKTKILTCSVFMIIFLGNLVNPSNEISLSLIIIAIIVGLVVSILVYGIGQMFHNMLKKNEFNKEEKTITNYLFYCKDKNNYKIRLSKTKVISWVMAILCGLLIDLYIILIPDSQGIYAANLIFSFAFFGFVAWIVTFSLSSIVVKLYEKHKH